VLQTASYIAEHVPEDATGAVEVASRSSRGIPGVARAIYGVSMRIGPRVAPPRRRPKTLRTNARKQPVIDDAREPAVDVLDEGDHFLVVAELPGVQETQVEWRLANERTLLIRAESPDRHYRRDIRVTEPIDAGKVLSSYANGVLELRLWKQMPR